LKFFVLKTKRESEGQWGFGGEAPDAVAILQLLFQKYAFFRHKLIWFKFRIFKWLNKVLMALKAFAPRRVPRFPSLFATPLGANLKVFFKNQSGK